MHPNQQLKGSASHYYWNRRNGVRVHIDYIESDPIDCVPAGVQPPAVCHRPLWNKKGRWLNLGRARVDRKNRFQYRRSADRARLPRHSERPGALSHLLQSRWPTPPETKQMNCTDDCTQDAHSASSTRCRSGLPGGTTKTASPMLTESTDYSSWSRNREWAIARVALSLGLSSDDRNSIRCWLNYGIWCEHVYENMVTQKRLSKCHSGRYPLNANYLPASCL